MQELDDRFLECRDPGLRHLWRRTSDFHVVPVVQMGRKLANLARSTSCDRCGTRKVERFIVNGEGFIEKIGTHYDYPEGYLLKGIGAPRGVKRSSVVWTENYRRAMKTIVANQAAQQEMEES